MSLSQYSSFKHFLISSPSPDVVHVEINRPEKMNAFYEAMWIELGQIFNKLSHDPDVRAVVFSGAGERAFTAGLDVEKAGEGALKKSDGKEDVARRAVGIRRHIDDFQDCVSAIEKCEKPVICVLHGYSFGLGLDMAACADIRIAAANTKFSVKEVDIGIAADIGILTRLPKVVGNFSWVKDVAMSARVFDAEEAYRVGLVSKVFKDKQATVQEAIRMAAHMATKSPLAVTGTKELLNHARDHNIADSLRYTGVWNAAAIQTVDMEKAILSGLKRTKPTFEKL